MCFRLRRSTCGQPHLWQIFSNMMMDMMVMMMMVMMMSKRIGSSHTKDKMRIIMMTS